MNKIAAFLHDVLDLCRRAGFKASARLLWSRIFSRTEMLLYEQRTTGLRPDLPDGWRVTEVRSMDDAAGLDLLLKAGGERELRYFKRGAVAYVLSIGDEQAARSWYFPHSQLARRLGPDTAYFTHMFVQPAWRGHGIQGWFNAYIASFLPAGTRLVMEVEQTNVASQKGLARGNSVFAGRLHTTILLGQVVHIRVDESPHPGNPGPCRRV